jgi:hypothetical protein
LDWWVIADNLRIYSAPDTILNSSQALFHLILIWSGKWCFYYSQFMSRKLDEISLKDPAQHRWWSGSQRVREEAKH